MSPLSPLDNILPQWLPFADLPPSPSDTSPSPAPHVVCDVPLLAPRPLPYHSPTFLQFDLPDTDEDLSHPPYTHRPAKRKRDLPDDPVQAQPQSKRRPAVHRRISRPPHRPWDHPPPSRLSHRAGNRRSRA